MLQSKIVIDGSAGEGGGQVLRSSLALSLVTGRPFRIEGIRARRARPGLLRQHLTAVRAAVEISSGTASGDAIGSSELRFSPSRVRAGDYRFAIGTAGSTTLVLQTVLPALLTADGPSTLVLEGGTHNPFAPPYEFLAQAFLPVLSRMGPRVTATLARPGFYPAGGGELSVTVHPAMALSPLELFERGPILRRFAKAAVASLPRRIAQRELDVARERLGLSREEAHVEEVEGSRGPGNVLTISLQSEAVTEVFTGFGERGVSAEEVANRASDEARDYLAHGAPVGVHLADQLLIPLALAGEGGIRTGTPSSHTLTNLAVIEQFLGPRLSCQALGDGTWRIESRNVE